MAMRFEDREEDSIVAEINITPLTDVFLVLLIIFMITSSAMLEQGLNVKLPSASTSSVAQGQSSKPVYVTVDKSGNISVNENFATSQSLREVLEKALLTSADGTVVIRGDESIVLGKAVEIMDTARSAGAKKIAIATQPTSK